MKPLPIPRPDFKASAVYRLLDGVSDAVVVFDSAAHILYVNAAAQQALGAATGAPLSRLEPALGEPALGWIRSVLDGGHRGAATSESSCEVRLAQGHRVTLKLSPLDFQRWALSAAPLSGGEGERRSGNPDELSTADERDIARLHLAALVDSAGVGLATYHESLGWLRTMPDAQATGPGAQPRRNVDALQSIGRDVVEASSLPEYERLQQALRRGEQIEVRYAVRHPDVGVRWLMTRVEPGRLASGDRVMSVVTLDMTEPEQARERSEQLLARQAEHTRAILDSVLVGIVTVVGAGIEWMNRSARRMFGGELSDFLGQPLAVVATPEASHPFRHDYSTRGLPDGQATTFECRIRARDGREFWVVGNVVATVGESGPVQLTYALLDIDRRRQAEAKSAQSQASLQRIIESAPLAISLCDARTLQVIQINQIAAVTLGRSVADCLGRSFDELVPAPAAQQRRADMQAALAAGDVTRREYRSVDAHGEHHWDARYLPLRTGTDAAPDQLLLVATDVTEQRAAERDRLAAAVAQRDMLVKEVHHRIKNNLQGVAALLQQVAQRRPEVASAIAEAVGQVQAIANVYGLQVSPTQPVCAERVVAAIIAAVQRNAARRIELAMTGDETLRWALPEAESIPLALCLNELLSNAVKHAESGDIVCTLELAPAQVRLAIANPGRLPQGFELERVRSGVSGLGLVRALLPRRSAALSLTHDNGLVVATVTLMAPVVVRLEAA